MVINLGMSPLMPAVLPSAIAKVLSSSVSIAETIAGDKIVLLLEFNGSISTHVVRWLLTNRDEKCYLNASSGFALLVFGGHDGIAQSILQYGRSTNADSSVWSLLEKFVTAKLSDTTYISETIGLLRAMLLRDPPSDFATDSELSPKLACVIEEGMRLRAALPAYLRQRRAFLDTHTPLIAPLQALVSGYEQPTTEELWATGLGKDRLFDMCMLRDE
jgi:hypothetical protein